MKSASRLCFHVVYLLCPAPPPKDMTLSVDGCCMSDRLSVYGADHKSRTEGRRKLRTGRNDG